MKIVFFSFSRGLPFPIEPDWDNMRSQDWSNWVKWSCKIFYHNIVRCTKVHFICSSNILCRAGFKEENIATLPAHSESHYVTPPHIYCDITHRINPSGGVWVGIFTYKVTKHICQGMTWTNPRSCADSPSVLYEMGSVKSPASQILLHHSISLFSLYCTSSSDISSYGGDGGVYLRKYFFLSCEKKCICKDESSSTGKEEIEEEYLSRNVNCSLERRSVFARKYIFLSSFCPFSGIPSASHWLHQHLIPLHYLHWPSFQNRATLQPLSLWVFLIRKGKYQICMAFFPKQSYSQTTFSRRFFDQKRKKHTYLALLPK